VRIGWRSTQLRTLTNTVVVMPNSTLAKAIITNYSMPEPRMSLVIPVSVAYGTDPPGSRKSCSKSPSRRRAKASRAC
jgi:small-conductance mechanosensitive channel